MYKLTKCSAPGWERDFDSLSELVGDLEGCICPTCWEEMYEELDLTDYETLLPKPKVLELLSTRCGCEYMVQAFDGNDNEVAL